MSGHTLAGGICAALLQRSLTGKSSVVDGSLIGTAVWFNGPAINAAAIGRSWGGAGIPREERDPRVNNYWTKDKRFSNLCMLSGDPDWADLVKHIGSRILVVILASHRPANERNIGVSR